MSMTDPIADCLTRIRNASRAKKNAVDIPASNVKKAVVNLLKENRYVEDMIELPDNKQGILRVYLRYSKNDEPVLHGLERVSRPGRRAYWDAERIRLSAHHMRGMFVVTTSQGLMTNFDAAQRGIGGEVVCRCW